MHERHDERGFVLVTTLVILMILMIMGIALFYNNQVNQQSSTSSRDATKAYYLAETGLNYIAYALNSVDSDTKSTTGGADLDQDGASDIAQLLANPNQQAPSDTAFNVLGYLDLKNTIGYNPATGLATNITGGVITLSTVSTWAPAHVELDITTNANNVPSVQANWGGGNLYPGGDGAIVWVVPAVYNPYDAMKEADSINTNGSYSLYAYSIGYVNGKPLRMLRAKVATMVNGFPSDLGATTNAYVP